MPWLETSPVDQRERFIADHQCGLYAMTEVCARYGISRKSGYKWLDRFTEEGRRGLQDRSRAPHHCPHRIPRDVAQLICAARRAHPSWGPEKLLDWLKPRYSGVPWPAVSTAGDLLARRGLVKRRRRHQHPGVVPPTTSAPNDLWTADFKGHFRTRDGIYCYPLTIADQHTRYLLACQGLRSMKGRGVRGVFEQAFRTFGLPQAIQHQRILPAHPQQNGAHERLHKTLKAGDLPPPRGTLAAQQHAFNAFRTEYNEERPHETLGGRPPGTLYRPAPRAYPEHPPPLDYPGHFLVKRVTNAGTFRLKHRLVFIANALKQHHIGLEEADDGIWSIYFGRVLLARLDERD